MYAAPPEVPGTNTSTFFAVRRPTLITPTRLRFRSCGRWDPLRLNEEGVPGAAGAAIHSRLILIGAVGLAAAPVTVAPAASAASAHAVARRAAPKTNLPIPSPLSIDLTVG